MKVVWTDRAKLRLRENPRANRDGSSSGRAQDRAPSGPALDPALAGAVFRAFGREYEREDVREVLVRPYRIIYLVVPAQARVDVLSVRHYRQLLPSDLTDL